MQALVDVVARVEVASEHSLKVRPNQALDHFSRAGVMVLKIAHAGRRDTPDGAIEAIFPPARFIGLDSRTRTNLGLELLKQGVQLLFDAMEQLDNLSNADL